MTNHTIIGAIPRNHRESVVVILGAERGGDMVDVRIHRSTDGSSIVTKHGITVAASKLPGPIRLLVLAASELRQRTLT